MEALTRTDRHGAEKGRGGGHRLKHVKHKWARGGG